MQKNKEFILDHPKVMKRRREMSFNVGLLIRRSLLPNVETFEVLLKIVDEFAKSFGIERALERVYKLSAPYSRPNKYLSKQLKKLDKYAKEGNSKSFETLY